MHKLDLSDHWQIILNSDNPTALLAARELQTFLERICGKRLAIHAQPEGHNPSFYLCFLEGDEDGFEWHRDNGDICITGFSPRGLLYGVYSFLEALGCCWFAPGAAGEVVPQGSCFDLPDEPVREKPALPGRCLIIGHQAFMEDVADWVVWAGRNRLNTIFFHTTNGSLALGAVPESQYLAFKAVYLPLMQERGMTLEHGGHGLADLLPRSLFTQMPEAFRLNTGKRTPDHNFCPSCQPGLDIIRQNAEKHFSAHPEVDVFHLWADDIPGGGWCECETCCAYTASEQLLLATNAVAEALQAVNPAAQISFIAYHDTETLPVKVTPHPNVHMLWAPRMRCYAHGSEDAACSLNVPHYNQTFRKQAQYFQHSKAKPARIFEYYLDAVLFKSVLPPLPAVIQQDVRFYRDAGAHTLQALMTGDYAWTSPQLNVWLFPRLAWNPEQNLDHLITQFSRAAFGCDLLAYYRALEAAFAIALDIVPEQVRLTVVHGIQQIWDTPPADMGDPVFAPVAVLEQKCSRHAEMFNWIAQAEGILQKCKPGADRRLETELSYFELQKQWLTFDHHRLHLYTALEQGELLEAKNHLRKAFSALKKVYRWGQRNIKSAKQRVNFHFIQFYTWQIRLEKIHAEHFSKGLMKKWREFVTKTCLARLYIQLRGMYSSK